MANLIGLVKQLQRERDRVAGQLHALDAALTAFVSVFKSKSGFKSRKRRKMSRAARARIAAAQRARWAKVKGRKVVSIASRRHSSRHISPAGRARIAAAARARWAKVRAGKK